MTMERRALTTPPEVRAAEGGRTIAGYAAVFNSETVIGGAFRERILPGAFSEAIKGDVRAFFNHDSAKVLGRTKSGTLRLREDDYGLAYDVDLPDTSVGRDLAVSMERGDIDGSSFGFQVPPGGDEWDWSGDLPLRTVRTANLFEVSPVSNPAYDDTTAALRSMEGAKVAAERERNEARGEAEKRANGYFKRKAETEQRIRRL